METLDNIPVVYAKGAKEWRKWLEKNQHTGKPAWLTIYHKKSARPSIGYAEAIEHALCFGWIDGKAMKRDEESFYLFFKERNPGSTWSKVNRERAAKMSRAGLMMERGQAMIDLAKKKGTWDSLKDAENEVIPAELQKLFNKNKTAFKHFQAFAPSSRRHILAWILKAKRPETRQRRMEQTITLAAQNIKANHPA
jgi:uncharacterized protein YdeI (YjbR/CyaY-like superfamily)